MKKSVWDKMLRVFIGIALILPMAVLAGCNGDDDDESVITVCNMDNEEYTVKLHRSSDGTVVDQFSLGEWYDITDQCDDFNDYNGEFYITIHEDNAEDPSDTSSTFYIEEGEYEEFSIDNDGDIDRIST
ncbi:MAG: hypothetical protein AB7S75_15880 [Desulfococcaceae bacterium]